MLKRIFDCITTATGLIILTPVLFVLYCLVRKHMDTPVFFKQKRPGLHSTPFYMYKFRTMTNVCDDSGTPLPDCDRLTPLGKFLRSTSLDELPELFNVLQGNMSLVGPRPLLMQYLDRYTPEQARRHEVRPGITGWAQVNGRNALSWEEKFKLDVWYVDNRTLWLDLRILALTIFKVITREGINGRGCETMTEFEGTDKGLQKTGEKKLVAGSIVRGEE